MLHVGAAKVGQDRIVDQPRPAQRVHQIKLHLHADGVLVAGEPAVVDHAAQCGNASLQPVAHFVLVADHQAGGIDAVTHGTPPRGTARARPQLQHAFSGRGARAGQRRRPILGKRWPYAAISGDTVTRCAARRVGHRAHRRP
ncbi:hypothetical protein BZL29_4683 [Mycobacterium kansasii]|uniref:Uncharacterized protein n=1 Tax=Mycobacterium kansasii TaxID=1768 RepID=A0A1V3X5R3_MYCKA|nr:hypothetical protein BZL29_4683 [Mycobacterium kansasii]